MERLEALEEALRAVQERVRPDGSLHATSLTIVSSDDPDGPVVKLHIDRRTAVVELCLGREDPRSGVLVFAGFGNDRGPDDPTTEGMPPGVGVQLWADGNCLHAIEAVQTDDGSWLVGSDHLSSHRDHIQPGTEDSH